MTPEIKPFVAWARSAPGHKAFATPVDHATRDGTTTLCGIREIGGSDRSVPYDSGRYGACRRCARHIPSTPERGE